MEGEVAESGQVAILQLLGWKWFYQSLALKGTACYELLQMGLGFGRTSLLFFFGSTWA
jgi:hypothetical protein